MNVLPLGKGLTIAVDIDGTVADSSQVNFDLVDSDPSELMKSVPIKGSREAVQKLYDEGHTIVFHTSRNHKSKEVTEAWLKKHGFPFHHLEMRKLVAHVYIDDRAINGCSWHEALKELEKPNLPGKRARAQGMI
jgi:uncharacterized HAD superfamily protein